METRTDRRTSEHPSYEVFEDEPDSGSDAIPFLRSTRAIPQPVYRPETITVAYGPSGEAMYAQIVQQVQDWPADCLFCPSLYGERRTREAQFFREMLPTQPGEAYRHLAENTFRRDNIFVRQTAGRFE